MGEWKANRLENLLIKVIDNRGKNPPYSSDGYEVIETSSISGKNRYPNYSEVKKFVDEKTYLNWFRSGHPKKDDILIITVGNGIGNLCIMSESKGVLTQNLIALRFDKEKSDPKFYYYYLSQESVQSFLSGLDIGSAQPSLKVPHLLSIEVPHPPLTEQRNIASMLNSLEDKIDLLHRQNKTLEQLAETLFRQWFVEEAGEGWKKTILDQHIEVFRGLSYKGSGLTIKDFGLPMHNLNSVYEGGGYKYDGIKFYSGEYKERHLINPSDIIVTNTEQGHEFRLIGCPAIVPDHFGKIGLFSQHIYKLGLLKHTYLSREFIYYLLMTQSVREQIISATNGSTVNMLAIDGLQRPEFKLPPEEKVATFTNIVANYWKKKNSNYNQINTLTKLRDTLLPKLMSGEVKVAY